MAYIKSKPLQRWLGERADALGVLTEAHALARVSLGRGRPLDVSKPLARAYVIAVVSEFQGFCRDLHDLAVRRLVSTSGASARCAPLLTEGLSQGRGLDRGNADLRALRQDFARIGLESLDLDLHNPRWSMSDRTGFLELFRLRNALAHGNDRELERLSAEGVVDTVNWTHSRVAVLNRVAQSLDRLVWDHLATLIDQDPWR